MKKINRFFVAAIVGIAAACSQELSDETPGVNTGNTEEAIPENYIELTFATNATDVKTSVDGNTVSWSEGDKILVCWDGDSMESNAVEIKDGMAYFTVSVDPEATDFYAVYPSTIAASVTDGSFSVTVPQSQSGRFADADIIVAKTTKDVLVYNFRHAVSLVKFVISDDNTKGITRAQFVDLANDSQLYGTMAITFDEDNQIATSTVTEDPTLDVIDVTAVQTGDNYMAVLPGKALAGFGLRLGSESKWHPGLVGENAITLGERLSLGTVDTKIHEGDYYIKTKATGNGNGTSWENAGDAALLQSLMGSYESIKYEKNLARSWRINGKTIKVSEGKYTSVGDGTSAVDGFSARYTLDEPITFKIEGGYTSSGEESASARPIFGTDTGTDTDPNRAFFIYGSVDVTLENLVISGHMREGAAGGGAVFATGGSKVDVKDCTFSNNSTQNGRGGGAVLVSSCQATFSNCDFLNNGTNFCGGAVFVDTGATVVFDRCNFENNSATKENISNGGALYIKQPTTIKNCTFTNNYVTKSTEYNNTHSNGGAIYSTSEITMDNCSFNGNYASDGGALFIYRTGSLKANECEFIGNYTNGYRWYLSTTINGREASAVLAFEDRDNEDNTASAYFSSCEFKDNYAPLSSSKIQAGNISFVYASSTRLGFNNCIFFDNCTDQKTDAEKTAWSIYTRGYFILVNSTMIDDCSNAVLYPTGSSNVYNNIIINAGSGNGIRGLDTSTSHDYNIISSYFDTSITKATHEVIATALDSGVYTEAASGMSYYLWSGTQDGFTQTTKENVASAIQSNTTFGADFYNWLNGLNALDYDIRGVARTNGYWPGSYQNN